MSKHDEENRWEWLGYTALVICVMYYAAIFVWWFFAGRLQKDK